jgi:hypothetical protein
MLRFSNAQQDWVLANRRAFAVNQSSLASQYDLRNSTALIGNASPLPKDVWGEWDRDAVEIQRDTLAVFNDLAASVAKPMNIGKLVHYFQTVSDSGEANITLDGRGKARTDQQAYDYHGTPLPIIDSAYGYGWREWAAAMAEGFGLDGTGRMNANRRVAEKLESIALDGDSSIVVGGNQLFGLRNHPKRNTRATGVTLNGATGAQFKAEIVALIKLLHADNHRSQVTLYVNFDDWFYASNTRYNETYGDKSIAQVIREIDGVGAIVPASSVNANEVFGVIKRRDVVEVLNGMPITNRAKFRQNPEDDYEFLTIAAAALEIKFDAEDQCGVAHSS